MDFKESQPGKPEVWGLSPVRIGLTWTMPCTSDNTVIDFYLLKMTTKERVITTELTNFVKNGNSIISESDYMPGVECRMSIIPCFKNWGYGIESEKSDQFILTASETDIRLARSMGANHLHVGKPGKPIISKISPMMISIKWRQAKVFYNKAIMQNNCIIMHSPLGLKPFPKLILKPEGDLVSTELPLEPNKACTYKIKTTYTIENKSFTIESETSDEVYLEASPRETALAKLLEDSPLLHKNSPSIYRLKMIEDLVNKEDRIVKCSTKEKNDWSTEKVIMLVGATGSGKSTLINGIVNYVLGVDWEDDFRFQMIVEESHKDSQAFSQTSWVTAYTLHHKESLRTPYTLTIIDTPGFGDTSGIDRDKQITEQIRKFFSVGGPEGIDHIDAIGFVAQSSLPRLTVTQRYIFEQILSLFGKDIEENIFLLLTFADGQIPQVLSGIEAAGFPYGKFFKFNNSALFINNSQGAGQKDSAKSDKRETKVTISFDEMFWKMGEQSYDDFLSCLDQATPQTLTLTKEVLHERQHIELSIIGIQTDIRLGLNKLETMKTEIELLNTWQAQIEANKNFEYTVIEDRCIREEIPHGRYTTNCLQCNRTCHYPCAYADDEDKRHCSAMRTDLYCGVCPDNCFWNRHKNMQYRIEWQRTPVVKTSEELMNKHRDATGKKRSVEEKLQEIAYELSAVQLTVIGMTQDVRESLNRLDKIALRPNALSATEYIDILIQSEKDEAKPGWSHRVEHFMRIRRQTEYLQQLKEADYDPFKEYMSQVFPNPSNTLKPIMDSGFEPLRERIEKEETAVMKRAKKYFYRMKDKVVGFLYGQQS